MASIIDSIRSVNSDKYSLLKMGAFSYLVYLIYNMAAMKDGFNAYNAIILLLLLLLYMGFCSIIINNRINQRIESLPSGNLNLYIEVSFKSLGLAIPFFIASMFLTNIFVGMFSFEGIPQQIAIWLIRFWFFCMYITALINFSENFDFKAGINISKISNGAADVIGSTILGSITILLISVVSSLPILYLIYTFYKFNVLFQYVAALFVTIDLAIFSDYWGQLHYDISSRDNYY